MDEGLWERGHASFIMLYKPTRLFCAISYTHMGHCWPMLPCFTCLPTRYLSLYACFLYTSIHVRRDHSMC